MANWKPVRVHDEAYKAWLRTQPCRVCGRVPCEPHHTTTRGAWGGDDTCCSLASDLHAEVHRIGRHTFAAKYRIDLAAEAKRQWAEFHRLGRPNNETEF